MRRAEEPVVYLPSNEPYLGLQSIVWFDHIIVWALDASAGFGRYTVEHTNSLTPIQRAASEIVPQALGIALSCRELLRQAYLLSSQILLRPLIERVAILSYLHQHPESIQLWQDGWLHGKRPSLKKMLASMAGPSSPPEVAQQVAEFHNHLVHGDPVSAQHNLVPLSGGALGFAVGKNLVSPQVADNVAVEAQAYLVTLIGRTSQIFPEVSVGQLRGPTGGPPKRPM